MENTHNCCTSGSLMLPRIVHIFAITFCNPTSSYATCYESKTHTRTRSGGHPSIIWMWVVGEIVQHNLHDISPFVSVCMRSAIVLTATNGLARADCGWRCQPFNTWKRVMLWEEGCHLGCCHLLPSRMATEMETLLILFMVGKTIPDISCRNQGGWLWEGECLKHYYVGIW